MRGPFAAALLATALASGLALPRPSVAAAPRAPLAAMPIARLDLPWWRQRFEDKAARLRQGMVDLAFYGDSITQNFEKHGPPEWQDIAPVWQRFYGDRRAVNLGFKGDTTASLLWRLEHGEAQEIAPKAAVVLIGANNLGRLHWSAADTLAGIAANIDAIRRNLPHTKILLLGILPSARTEWATQVTREVNAGLARRYAGDGMVLFRDVGAIFERDGRLERDLFYDPRLTPPDPPLHPTAEGMRRIAEAIEPDLAAMLGDRPHGGR